MRTLSVKGCCRGEPGGSGGIRTPNPILVLQRSFPEEMMSGREKLFHAESTEVGEQERLHTKSVTTVFMSWKRGLKWGERHKAANLRPVISVFLIWMMAGAALHVGVALASCLSCILCYFFSHHPGLLSGHLPIGGSRKAHCEPIHVEAEDCCSYGRWSPLSPLLSKPTQKKSP
ncbi:hypothetical protein CB1_000157032 [Camelus ferus]|nr:hypothetical protein CB1_000157032 [Camelus ferus]